MMPFLTIYRPRCVSWAGIWTEAVCSVEVPNEMQLKKGGCGKVCIERNYRTVPKEGKREEFPKGVCVLLL